MKKVLLMLFSITFALSSYAQKWLPEIKKGTVLNSSAFVNGQEFPLKMTIASLASPVSIAWSVEGYGDGSFEMSDKALESANQLAMVTQPALGVTKLPDNEAFGLISKAAYKTLMDTKALTASGIKFKLKVPAMAIKIGGKEVDAVHFISEDGKLEFWVLNNPAFPLILQSVGMPTDIVINEIK